MKTQAYTIIAIMVLFGCMAGSVRAQCNMPAVAKIPFPFSTGKATLPAGEYRITCLDPNEKLVLIQSKDRNVRSIILMISLDGRGRENGKLVFHRYGNRYFFVQAWDEGSTGLELPTTRAERRVANEVAGIKPKTETIALTVRKSRRQEDRPQ